MLIADFHLRYHFPPNFYSCTFYLLIQSQLTIYVAKTRFFHDFQDIFQSDCCIPSKILCFSQIIFSEGFCYLFRIQKPSKVPKIYFWGTPFPPKIEFSLIFLGILEFWSCISSIILCLLQIILSEGSFYLLGAISPPKFLKIN